MRFSGWYIGALLLVAACQTVPTSPNTYYVSSIDPSANDHNPGTQAQPWRTLTRVQSALDSLNPGDQILLQRGSIFDGGLSWVGARGTPDAPITLGAYGDGDNPILSGAETLREWISIGVDRWQASCATCEGAVNGLMIDGELQAMARHSNPDQGDDGYLYFDSAASRFSISDDALRGDIDWSGGELVVRSIAWVLDRLLISAHEGDTLVTTDPASYDLTSGYGYFIQNHANALDRDGEWIYDADTQMVTLYWSAGEPSAFDIEVTARDSLLRIEAAHHIEVRDLTLHGADALALYIERCSHVGIVGVSVINGGADGIRVASCDDLNVANSRIAHMLNNGANIDDCQRCTLYGSTIEHIGLLAGMGGSGDGKYLGVRVEGEQTRFERNRIEHIGYIGVIVVGNVWVQQNVVRHFTQVKIDGGGIYAYRTQGSHIIGNLVVDGMGNTAGTPLESPSANGIYIDDNSMDIDVRANIIGWVGAAGIYLHNTHDVRVTDNLVVAAGESALRLSDDDLGTYNLENTLITRNLWVAFDPAAALVVFDSNNNANMPLMIGTSDRNRFFHFNNTHPLRMITYPPANAFDMAYTLNEWRAAFGLEGESVGVGAQP